MGGQFPHQGGISKVLVPSLALVVAVSSSNCTGALCVWQHPPAPVGPHQAWLSLGNEAVTAEKAFDCSCWHPGGAPCLPTSHHTVEGRAFFELCVCSAQRKMFPLTFPPPLFGIWGTHLSCLKEWIYGWLCLLSPHRAHWSCSPDGTVLQASSYKAQFSLQPRCSLFPEIFLPNSK